MNKPEDIPQDVWEAAQGANDALWALAANDDEYHQDTEAIARAILAERERCAEVARNVRRDVLQANAASREAPALLHVDRVLELIVYPNGNPMYIRPTSPRGTP